MLNVFQGTARYVPVRLRNRSGAGVVNVPFTAITVSLSKDGSFLAVKLMDVDSWRQIGKGHYMILLSVVDTDTPGTLIYDVDAPETEGYCGAIEVNASWSTATALTAARDAVIAALPPAPNNVAILAARDAALAIPTTPLLTNDARLVRLDVAVSTRATPADVATLIPSLLTIQAKTDLLPIDPAAKSDLPPAPNDAAVLAAVAALQTAMNDLMAEAFGRWVLDFASDTLTLYRPDGSLLKTFSLTRSEETSPSYVARVPA